MFRFTNVTELPGDLFYTYLAERRLAYEAKDGSFAVLFGKSHGQFVGFYKPRHNFYETYVFQLEDTIARDYPIDPDHSMDWTRHLIQAGERFMEVDSKYVPLSCADFIEYLSTPQREA